MSGCAWAMSVSCHAQNQTDDLTPLSYGGVPFQLEIEQLELETPGLAGLHSGAYCVVDSPSQGDLLFFVGGRANEAGMHGFDCPAEENFAKDDFNRTLYLVDPFTGEVWQRGLDDPASGLTSEQADQLSAVNFLDNQIGDYLLVIGGYGYSQDVDDWVTFDKMAVIELDGVVEWIQGASEPLSDSIQFLSPPDGAPEELYTVTGGVLVVVQDELWLCLGQEFQGMYDPCNEDASTQVYKQDFYRLQINESKGAFPYFTWIGNSPQAEVEWARRRDLNVFPAYVDESGSRGAVALSGVFTLDDGAWTVPVVMHPDGTMVQPPPDDPGTLRQGFNMYASARMTAWSEATGDNWFVIGGGIGYQFFLDGSLETSSFLPYSSIVSAVRYNPGDGSWGQHLLGCSYPRIPVPDTDEYYRFGTETYMFPASPYWIDGRILDLDSIQEPTLIGLLYGGIMVAGYNEPTGGGPNRASNYFFTVTLSPGEGCPADFDGTGEVGGSDLADLLAGWGKIPVGTNEAIDINDDGYVNGIDLGILLGSWGACN